ncbi:hypothetical protein M0804_000410 [Polistes exclamans]|nr:hypothetical protein M0804_000410 [Polistes exclamans]
MRKLESKKASKQASKQARMFPGIIAKLIMTEFIGFLGVESRKLTFRRERKKYEEEEFADILDSLNKCNNSCPFSACFHRSISNKQHSEKNIPFYLKYIPIGLIPMLKPLRGGWKSNVPPNSALICHDLSSRLT